MTGRTAPAKQHPMFSFDSVAITKTLKSYEPTALASDLTAAVIVTLMLVPQSLAYAMLAGLPPQIGLYSSLLPLMVYAIFGTSQVLAVGPVAVISLMTGTTIMSIDASLGYVPEQIAIHLAALSGFMLLLMSILRLGFMVNFMSRSVIDGFIMASALLIILSQLKHLLDIDIHGHNAIELFSSLLEGIGQTHTTTLILGLAIMGLLIGSNLWLEHLLRQLGFGQKLATLVPRLVPAILVVASIYLVSQFPDTQHGIEIVGDIPSTLPTLQFFTPVPELIQDLLLPALLIAVIGYVESISVAIEFASKTQSSISANKELLALGLANISSSVSGGMPVTGGFSRSVVNYQAGARTPLAGIFAAIFMGLLIVGVGEQLSHLPKVVLAVTIIVAVSSLISFNKLHACWRFSRYDFALTLLTIIITLLHSVEMGVSVGIVLSICLHLYQTSKPHLATVGLVPGTEHFRNILRHDVDTEPTIIGIRIDENLYFANAQYLESEIIERVTQSPGIKYCILQCTSVSDIDSTALHCLDVIYDKLQAMGIELHLSEVKGPVMDKLQNSELYDKLEHAIHLTHFQAVSLLKTK